MWECGEIIPCCALLPFPIVEVRLDDWLPQQNPTPNMSFRTTTPAVDPSAGVIADGIRRYQDRLQRKYKQLSRATFWALLS